MKQYEIIVRFVEDAKYFLNFDSACVKSVCILVDCYAFLYSFYFAL